MWGLPGLAQSSTLCIVVLASHSQLIVTVLRCLGVSSLVEETHRVVLASTVGGFWHRGRRPSFSNASDSITPRPARRPG